MKQENMVNVKQEKGASLKFEMRAPPRRRAKGDELEEQPVFLRKAFHMISTCPPEIGGWSQNGDTVVIKDVKEFSEKVIPTAYKHNNFSSFVRQLNFYGFRKVKSESLQNPTWWEFRHPNFLRDQPQLLADMKRSMHFVAENNGQEVCELKNQVADLTEKIAVLNFQVEKLTGAVTHIQDPAEIGPKRRKVHAKNSADVERLTVSEGAPLQRINSLESNLMIEEFKDHGDTVPMMEGKFSWLQPSTNNGEGMGMADEDDLLDCIGMDEFDLASTPRPPSNRIHIEETSLPSLPMASPKPFQVENIPTANPVIATPSTPLPAIATSDIAMFLDYLSPELKLRFVDKLAEYTSLQMMQNRNVFPVPATAEVSLEFPYESNEKHEFYLPSGSPAPRIALPLASAALSAFMMSNLQYTQSNASSNNMPINTPEPISSRG